MKWADLLKHYQVYKLKKAMNQDIKYQTSVLKLKKKIKSMHFV